ncbi:MAG: hypothetical protein KJ893_09690 [Candidatus Omnitrophica bacterium]|nr:hypothetical protein [Candidatus Omnitrophota bacterium]MBU4479253.1 hypothetical protein [Candidatus Omnitrophota bacterium]MCG2703071.1 hypothetical protein [Candidatus Omnitrophota bacterium]
MEKSATKEISSGKRRRGSVCFFLLRLFIWLIIITNAGLLRAEVQRDPFVSLSDNRQETKEFFDISKLPYAIELNGIIWKENKSVAIINNEIVQKGDSWKDFRVVEIKKDRVILEYGEVTCELLLKGKESKNP